MDQDLELLNKYNLFGHFLGQIFRNLFINPRQSKTINVYMQDMSGHLSEQKYYRQIKYAQHSNCLNQNMGHCLDIIRNLHLLLFFLIIDGIMG